MPRRGRLHVEGGCYHVMGRGLERRHIFDTAEDKQDFLDRLATGLVATDTDCLAWAVMSNHYHLLLRVSSLPLSELMRKLLSGYATAYNQRHNRVGYVFQNRFKSILCDEETYLLQLVRYIHLNPLKANMVKDIPALSRYPWSGHAALMGHLSADWQNTTEILSRFGSRLKAARQSYQAFMENDASSIDLSGGGLIRSYGGWEPIAKLRREHETKIGDERILGSSEFVESVTSTDALNIKNVAAVNLSEVVTGVCKYFDIAPAQLSKRGRQNALSNAKAVIAYMACELADTPTIEVANRLALSRSGVAQAAERGRLIYKRLALSLEILTAN